MAAVDSDFESELNVYAGLDSFNSNVMEKELEKCKELGGDVQKLKALGFNALQLSEIRKGLEDKKVDVNKYLNPKLSWTDMEEMRLEMSQGIDMSSYRQQGFDTQQIYQIRCGISEDLDVSVYAKKEYLADQMREIRKGLSKRNPVPIIFYQDPEFDSLQMREIRKGLQAGVDISTYAMVSMPYLKMRAIRESAEDGVFFEGSDIIRYNAGILNQIHLAHNEGVDITEYLKMKYDAEQLEQIRLALKDNYSIDRYIDPEMRGDAIKEVRLGLESGVDVGKYANSAYGWKQMYEMRIGLEHQIDIGPYCKPLYRYDQMREIRLGIEARLDITKYSSMMYTAKDMRRIRNKLLSGELQNFAPDDGIEGTILDRTEGLSDQAYLLSSMLQDRDDYLSVSEDGMTCYLKLPLRKDGISYTEDTIMTFLFKTKIRKGVDREGIRKMLENFEPDKEYVVAKGKECINGYDGYYEFFFDWEHKNDFKYLPDGSIDFDNVNMIQQVKVGDKIAYYHKSKKGEDGYNIHGEVIPAKNGKEIPIIKGDGFMIMNDRVTYVAKVSGSIEMEDGNIRIRKVMIIPEVKVTDKKISYDGVIYVVGDVNSGSEINATGDVIIGGHMESSLIESGGNVVIGRGATCPIRGGIIAKGNVTAKFFEGVRIKGKNISANYFINCEIEADGMLKTYGRNGVIYGGNCQSTVGLESAMVGNKTGAKTVITLGASAALIAEFSKVQKGISREKENIKALTTEKDRLDEINSGDRQILQWKIKINAALGAKEQSLRKLFAKRDELDEKIKTAGNARAVITEAVFTNTVFIIDGIGYKMTEDRKTYDKLIIMTDGKKENIIII